MKRTLIMMKGLPGSGKSTWAREFIAKHPDKAFRVNRDDLRDMMFDYRYSKPNEKMVRASRDELVQLLFARGAEYVVVDDTNLDPFTIKHVNALAALCDADLQVQDFTHVDIEVCKERNAARSGRHRVPDEAIDHMYNNYVCKREPAENAGIIPAIIVDLDGTLSHKSKGEKARGYYDWSRVGEDHIDMAVWELVQSEHAAGTRIIVVTGRDEVCREETERWLTEHDVPWVLLYMRKQDDRRKDYVVKEELYREFIEPSMYEVKYVLDDRDSVVEMWRSLGLKCFQVERGDF